MMEFMVPKEVSDKFYALETSLFLKEYLNDKDYLEKIFHPDFMEIGKTGNIYRKKERSCNYGGFPKNFKRKNQTKIYVTTN